MSKKKSEIVDLSTGEIVSRHPALARRDAAYARANNQHPRQGEDGVIVSPVPFAEELVGVRQLTIEEQIARFTKHGDNIPNLVPDRDFVDSLVRKAGPRGQEFFEIVEDDRDWHDFDDDAFEDVKGYVVGITSYEAQGLQNILHARRNLKKLPRGGDEGGGYPPCFRSAKAPTRGWRRQS